MIFTIYIHMYVFSKVHTLYVHMHSTLCSLSLSLWVSFFHYSFFFFLIIELYSAVPQSSIKTGSRAETRSMRYLDFGSVSSSLMQRLESRFTQWQTKIPAQHPANVFLLVLHETSKFWVLQKLNSNLDLCA